MRKPVPVAQTVGMDRRRRVTTCEPTPSRIVRKKEKNMDMVEESGSSNGEKEEEEVSVPLSEVVSACLKIWFNDTLKEAKAGNVNMQVLVAQMYSNGSGVPRDPRKGRIWMARASRVKSSAWEVINKRPGYNASDSDSDEFIEDS